RDAPRRRPRPSGYSWSTSSAVVVPDHDPVGLGVRLAREDVARLDLGVDESVVLGHLDLALLDPALAGGAHASLAAERQLGAHPEGCVEDGRLRRHPGLHRAAVEYHGELDRTLPRRWLRRKRREVERAGE